MTSGRTLAAFYDYDGLLAAIRQRVRELQIKGEAFDHFAGLPDGYLSKLIGERPVRRIGMTSLGPLFAALGIRCILIEDPEATERLRKQLKPRNGSFVRATRTVQSITDRKWIRIQKLGRQARWAKMSAAQRSKLARRLNIYRWRKNGNGHVRP
jgi:hypothetical protein